MSDLAQLLATRVAGAFVMQMPGWTSRTPSKPVAVAVMKGQMWHILAAVDLWNAIVSPPPALARFAHGFEWWSTKQPDVDAIANALVDLSRAWWEMAPEALGVLDVTGAITNALTSALGPSPGFFANVVSVDGPAGVHCGIGREVEGSRWPDFANVETHPDGVEVVVTNANYVRKSILVRTANDLQAALPEIIATLHATDDACKAWLVSLGTIQDVATKLAALLPGSWTTEARTDCVLVVPPAAVVCGIVNLEVTASHVRLRHRIFELSGKPLSSLAAELAPAIAAESLLVRADRLVEGARYRVLRAFKGASADDVLRFTGVTEIKPSGDDAWFFVRDAEPRMTVTLTSGNAEDVALLDSLSELLTAE